LYKIHLGRIHKFESTDSASHQKNMADKGGKMNNAIPTAEKPKDKEGRRSLVPSPEFIRAFLLYESVRCRNCGRILRSKRSIKLGFGPTCAIDFAARWIKTEPIFLGEKAKKLWSKEEISNLVQFARGK